MSLVRALDVAHPVRDESHLVWFIMEIAWISAHYVRAILSASHSKCEPYHTFQEYAFALNTGQVCDLLTWMLGGSCEAVSFSQSMIFLGKVSCPVPRHLMTKSGHKYVLVVLPYLIQEGATTFEYHKCSFSARNWSYMEAIATIPIGIYFVVKDAPYCWKWLSSYVLNSHSWAYNITPPVNVQYYLKGSGTLMAMI